MSPRSYPFRFYGREPADWSPPEHGFLYEVKFSEPLSAAQRERLAALYERHFREGPASALDAPWLWSASRFAVFAVGERRRDAPRMVFASVAEFLQGVHGVARVRDVLFSNGYGARADRWDAWSLAQSPSADGGPPRPDAPFAHLLRRPVDQKLAAYAPDADFERARAAERSPRGRAAPAPRAEAPAAPAKSAKRKGPETFAYEPASLEDYPAPERWHPSAFVKPERAGGDGDALVEGLRTPLARVTEKGKVVGLASLDAEQRRQVSRFPESASPTGPVAVDPEGLHALATVGNGIWEVALPGGAPRSRMSVHVNNGAVTGLAWTVDDLWAVLCQQQLMVDDLKDAEVSYVGAVRIYNGTSLASVRHGTMLLARVPEGVAVIGVSAWQLERLGTLHGQLDFAHEFQGEVLLRGPQGLVRAVGLDDAYERWAAPLRQREEADRKKRFASSRSTRPAKRPRWRHVEAAALPPGRVRAAFARLRGLYGDDAWFVVGRHGGAVVVKSPPGNTWSRSALLSWQPAEGPAQDLGDGAAPARATGVTNIAITPDEGHAFVVDGVSFNVHRIDLRGRTAVQCPSNTFVRAGGLLVNVIAVDADNLVALWVDALEWHRRGEDGRLTRVATKRLQGARGFDYEPSQRRLAVMSQARHRLLVVALRDGAFEVESRFTDPVKEVSFREQRLFAQMTDGVWFELESPRADAAGAESLPAESRA